MDLPDGRTSSAGACTLRRHAHTIEADHDRIRRAAASCEWSSPAADVFAARLEDLLRLIVAAGSRLAQTADALDRHERCARHRRAELAGWLP